MKCFATLVLLLGSVGLQACSCNDYINIFCYDADTSDHIALVEIVDIPEYSWAVIRILENINKTISNDTIEVVGQDGLNCGVDLGLFEIGDTLIVNLDNYNYTNSSNGLEYEWIFWDCHLRYLRYSEGNVIGRITNEINIQDYETFKTEIPFCYDFSSNSNEVENVEIHVFPNPTVNSLSIISKNINFQFVEIYDLKGKLVGQYDFGNEYKYNLRISNLNSGIYYIIINTPLGIIRRRIIKL